VPIPAPSLAQRNRQLTLEHYRIDQMHPDPRNPRVHPPAQIKALMKSVQNFGFNVPVLIDTAGLILAGHAVVEAARKLGMTELPVIRLEHLSETQARGFALAHNKLAEQARWDPKLLGQIFIELGAIDLDFDLDATGFAAAEIGCCQANAKGLRLGCGRGETPLAFGSV
jgi:ParB-like chromosome segregation protein Spo0J